MSEQDTPMPAKTAGASAVIHVAETLARTCPGKHKIRGPMDAVDLAREACAALLVIPEGRNLARAALDEYEGLADELASGR